MTPDEQLEARSQPAEMPPCSNCGADFENCDCGHYEPDAPDMDEDEDSE